MNTVVQHNRKIWIGRSLMLVAILHTIATFVFFSPVLIDIVQRGVWNTVGRDPMVATATWFFLFGPALALLGMAIHELEQQAQFTMAKPLAIGTLIMTTVGIVLMPDSGFWLAIPAIIGLFKIKNPPRH